MILTGVRRIQISLKVITSKISLNATFSKEVIYL